MDVLDKLVNRSIITVPHDASLLEAAWIMRNRRIGSLLVERNGQKVGILSETDVTRRAVAEGLHPGQVTVEAVMSHPIITLDIQSTPEMANDMMKERGIRHLAITESDQIVGIISVRDLLRYFKIYYHGIGSLVTEELSSS